MTNPRTATAPSPLVALGLCVTAGVLFVLPANLGSSVRSTLYDAATPGVAVVRSIGSTWTAARDRLFDRTEAEQRIAALETALAVAQSRTRMLELQHDRTRADDPQPLVVPDLLAANVLGAEVEAAWRAGRLVDVGLGDGVREEAAVLAEEGPLVDRGRDGEIEVGHVVLTESPEITGRTLVGRIRSVGRWTSIVQPITDPAYRVQVRLAHRAGNRLLLGPTGILRGSGEATCRLDFVGSTEPVAVGDEVYALVSLVATTTDPEQPPAADSDDRHRLYVGRVTTADLPRGAPHWEIEVTPAAPPTPGRVAVLRRRFNPQRPLD